MPNEILVSVDGSTHSDRVVRFSTEIAKKLSTGIVLLYVAPPSPIPEGFKVYAKEENVPESDYYDALGRQVLAKYADVVEKEGLACETLSEVGNPAEKITTIASYRKSELIIVGLQGLHGLARIRSLGSVSRRVIENSTIPVLVVP